MITYDVPLIVPDSLKYLSLRETFNVIVLINVNNKSNLKWVTKNGREDVDRLFQVRWIQERKGLTLILSPDITRDNTKP